MHGRVANATSASANWYCIAQNFLTLSYCLYNVELIRERRFEWEVIDIELMCLISSERKQTVWPFPNIYMIFTCKLRLVASLFNPLSVITSWTEFAWLLSCLFTVYETRSRLRWERTESTISTRKWKKTGSYLLYNELHCNDLMSLWRHLRVVLLWSNDLEASPCGNTSTDTLRGCANNCWSHPRLGHLLKRNF